MYRSSHLVSGPQVLVLLLTLTQSFPLSIQSLNEMSVLQTLQRELLRQNLELPLVRRQLLTSQTHTDFFVRTMTDKTSSEKKNQNNMWIPVLSVNVLQVSFSGAALWPTPLLHLPLQLQTVSVLDGFNCWEKNEVTQDFMRLIEGLLIKYQMQLVQVWTCYLTRADSSKYTQITDSSSCCWQDWWVSPHRLP